MILPIEPYLQSLTTDQRIKLEAYVEQFCQQDDAHLLFAAHAAFPAVLTADLLYKLWANFRSDELGTLLEWPTTLVSDLLLSPICQSIGRHIFEIPSSIRGVLQGYLNTHPLYGAKRLDRLAHFLKFYLQENSHKIPSPAFLQAQEFIYQVRLEPQKALESVVESWNNSTHISEVQHLIDQVEMLDNLRATQEDFSPNEKSKTRLSAAAKLFKSIQDYQRGQPEKALAWFQNFQGQIQEQASKGGIKVNIDHHLIEALPKDLVVKDERPVFLGVFMDPDHSMEKNAIQEIFKSIEGINVVLLSNPSKVFLHYNLDRFQENIVVFHFAGGDINFFLREEELRYEERSILFKMSSNLGLIFFNTDNSKQFANYFSEVNLKCSILATTGAIEDHTAKRFAENFYKAVVQDRAIAASYQYAISETLFLPKIEERSRRFDRNEVKPKSAQEMWALYTNDTYSHEWRLSDSIGSFLPDSFEAVEAKKSAYPHHLNFIPLLDNPEDCIGREEEIEDLHALLQKSDGTVAVEGEFGIGKTTVVRAYLTKYQYSYQHLVWISCSKSLVQSFVEDSQLWSLIESTEIDSQNQSDGFIQLVDVLNSISGTKLLVIDDYDNHYWEEGKHNLLSTKTGWKKIIIDQQTHLLDSLSIDELDSVPAYNIFHKYYQKEEKKAHELLALTRFNPLKIKLLAQLLTRFQGWLTVQSLLTLKKINFDNIASYLQNYKDEANDATQISNWLESGGEKELIEGAVSHYLDKNAENKAAHIVISAWLEANGSTKTIKNETQRYLNQNATRKEAGVVLTNWLKKRGDLETVLSAIYKFLDRHADSEDSAKVIEQWIKRDENPEKVVEYLKKYLNENANKQESFEVMVAWLMNEGALDVVKTHIKRYLDLYPTGANTAGLIIAWLGAEGDPEFVKDTLVKQLEQISEPEDIYLLVSVWLLANGSLNVVRESIKTLMHLPPNETFTSNIIQSWLKAGGELKIVEAGMIRYLTKFPAEKETASVISTWLDAGGDPNLVSKASKLYLEKNISEREAYLVMISLLKIGEPPKSLLESIEAHLKVFPNGEKTNELLKIWIEKGGKRDILEQIIAQEKMKTALQIRNLVSHNELKKALDLIQDFVPSAKINDVALLKGMLADAEKDRALKIMSLNEINRVMNKIANNVLELVYASEQTTIQQKIFISYSQRDSFYMRELVLHLQSFRDKQNLLWYDGSLMPGDNIYEKIEHELESSDIVIFLLSADFLADERKQIEVELAFDRKKRVIPILVKPCLYHERFQHIQSLPRNGRAISSSEDKDKAWLDIVREILRVINERS